MSPPELAAVLMENYDPAFAHLVRDGDVLVSGHNFGCGSSREQAATAFLAAGVRVIVAASFSETFKRNGFNNALVCIECPTLLEALCERHAPAGGEARTVRTGQHVHVDFEHSVIRVGEAASGGGVQADGGEAYPFLPIGRAVQDLVACGGMEAWVKAQVTHEHGRA
jgi:homoaconitate hydratase